MFGCRGVCTGLSAGDGTLGSGPSREDEPEPLGSVPRDPCLWIGDVRLSQPHTEKLWFKFIKRVDGNFIWEGTWRCNGQAVRTTHTHTHTHTHAVSNGHSFCMKHPLTQHKCNECFDSLDGADVSV